MDYLVAYMGIGVLAGLLAGLLGVGGGAVTVPLLLWAFGLQEIDQRVATQMALATSLAAMIATSLSSMRAHASRGAVLWPVFAAMGAGVLMGSAAGVSTAVAVPGPLLQIAFAGFLLYVSLQMMIGFAPSSTRRLPRVAGQTAVGGVIGCISMFFGIGGGSLTVPFLSYCGVAPARAVGTSAALGVPIAIWGTGLYVAAGWANPLMPDYSLGYVYGPAVLGIVLTSAVCARVGARLAHRLRPEQLRRVFGAVLLLVAAELLWNNLV